MFSGSVQWSWILYIYTDYVYPHCFSSMSSAVFQQTQPPPLVILVFYTVNAKGHTVKLCRPPSWITKILPSVDYHGKHIVCPKTHFLLISIYVMNFLNLHFNVGEVLQALTEGAAFTHSNWSRKVMRSSLQLNDKHYVAVNEKVCVLMVITG